MTAFARSVRLRLQLDDRFDLAGPLRGATTGPLYFTYDGHWTAAGHAVVADAIAGCLR